MTRPNPFSRLVIRASAGSGKTYQLSRRYLALLLEGVPVDAILATTFSRKAAGEIQDRILALLGDSARTPENAAKLSKELYGDSAAISQERLRDLAVEVVRSLHRLRVCTLDAFFMQIARGFAFEIGLPPGWKIEEMDGNRLLRTAIQASFAQSKTQNAVQLTRLLFKGESRRSVESQILEIVNSALPLYYQTTPDAWTRLGVGWSRPSAQELAQAVADLENAPAPTTKAGTPRKKFVDARKRLVDQAKTEDWAKFINETLVQNVASNKREFDGKELDEAVVAAVEILLQFAKQKTLADVASQTRATWIALDAISRFFEASKREEGAYRFEDLTRILSQYKLADRFQQIVYRLGAKTSHLLLDEFQDASFEQWSILEPFAESIASRESDPTASRGSFFCVGDVKQAIYGWRGGVAEIFNEIEAKIPNVETKELTRNWRSCPTIIETVNRLFLHIDENPVFQIDATADDDSPEYRKSLALAKAAQNWGARFTLHETAPSNDDKLGYFAIEVAPVVDSKESDVLPNFSEPPVDATGNAASQVAPDPTDDLATDYGKYDEISADLLDDFADATDDDSEGDSNGGGSNFGEIKQKQATLAYSVARIVRLRRKFPNATIGVLTRTNQTIAKIIASLKKREIDASEDGGVPLTDAASVGAILSALALANQPSDSVAKFHLANVGPLSEYFNLTPQNFSEPGTGRRVSTRIRRQIETLGIGRFVAELADVLTPICELRDRERLKKLVELAFCYQENETNVQIDRFIQTVRETKIESPSASTLRVMTIHKSKGLEFDVVVLPELDAPLACLRDSFVVRRETPTSPIDATIRSVAQNARQFLPSEFQAMFDDDRQAKMEEALCLLYVAVTRPVQALVAIIAPKKAPSKSPTFANILRAGLASNSVSFPDDDPRSRKAQILFEGGDKNWAKNDPKPESQRSVASGAEPKRFAPLAVSASTRPRTTFDRRLLQRETPTGGRSSRRWNRPDSFAFGTALHACFETVRWLDVDGPPSEERLRARLSTITQDSAAIRRTIRLFREICATPFVESLLSLSSYKDYRSGNISSESIRSSAVVLTPDRVAPRWEVFRERQFSKRAPDGKLWRGTIDRLVLLRDGDRVVGADVVDFKTDQVAPSEETETFDAYRRQIERYGDVVADWYALPREKISTRLEFVSKGKTIVVGAFPPSQPVDDATDR